MIVIDASSLAKYLLKEQGWSEVETHLELGVASVDHVIKEVSNAIWKHAVVRKVIPREKALEVFKSLLRLVEEGVVVLEDEERYLAEAFKISLDADLTLYDSLYVALALELGTLLTSDERQASIARRLGVEVLYIP